MDAPQGDPGRLSFLDRPLPPRFERRVVKLEPGAVRAYDEREWRDALVSVEQGAVELECHAGRRRRFEQGALLFLADVPLRTIRNAGPATVVLVAVSRRRGDPGQENQNASAAPPSARAAPAGPRDAKQRRASSTSAP